MKKAWSRTYYLSHCEQLKEKSRRYRLKHPEQIKEEARKYRLTHLAQNKKRSNAWKREHPEQTKTYRLAHREQIQQLITAWRQKHPQKGAEAARKWYWAHKEQANISSRAYWKTPRGKEAKKRSLAIRKQFGFIPLNKWFEGSEGHHIDRERVIYIPLELHDNIYHSITKNRNMEKINAMAFEFLASQKN